MVPGIKFWFLKIILNRFKYLKIKQLTIFDDCHKRKFSLEFSWYFLKTFAAVVAAATVVGKAVIFSKKYINLFFTQSYLCLDAVKAIFVIVRW